MDRQLCPMKVCITLHAEGMTTFLVTGEVGCFCCMDAHFDFVGK
jgi:hypothetical protein